jgi:hypothetical protein
MSDRDRMFALMAAWIGLAVTCGLWLFGFVVTNGFSLP